MSVGFKAVFRKFPGKSFSSLVDVPSGASKEGEKKAVQL